MSFLRNCLPRIHTFAIPAPTTPNTPPEASEASEISEPSDASEPSNLFPQTANAFFLDSDSDSDLDETDSDSNSTLAYASTSPSPSISPASEELSTTTRPKPNVVHATHTYLTTLLHNTPRHANISPLLYRHLQSTLAKAQEAIALLPTPCPHLTYLQAEISIERHCIACQLSRDERNTSIRVQIVDLRLHELLLTYGELLASSSPDFKQWINSSLFASKFRCKGDAELTEFLHNGISEEDARVEKWQHRGRRGYPPYARSRIQLTEIAKSLNVSFEKARNLIRLYNDRCVFGYPTIAKFYIGRKLWGEFGEMVVADRRAVGEMMATHVYLAGWRGLVDDAFGMLQDRYFEVLESGWDEELGAVVRWSPKVQPEEEDELISEEKKEKQKM